MPATSVAKISGAMIILIIRRNSWLKGRKYTAHSGWVVLTIHPAAIPMARPMKICCVRVIPRRGAAGAGLVIQGKILSREQAPRPQLARVEAGGSRQLPLPRGQRGVEAPFVGAPAGGDEAFLPATPPRRHPPGDGFDDEDGGAAGVSVEQARQPGAPEVVGQLVDGVGREDAEPRHGVEANAQEVLAEGPAAKPQ